MLFLWLLGFEPRSPRPQRGILTAKLQPPVPGVGIESLEFYAEAIQEILIDS
jgi:hypothetical protein